MKVFVLSKDLKPMMPCHPARARKLLKLGRAKVYRRYPFTIVMQDRDEFDVQEVELKIDPGSKTTGIALVAKFKRGNEVLWAADLNHKGQRIVLDLLKRQAVRRSRRNRKTRYRPARFNNRTRPKGWLPPSLVSRVNNVIVWAKKLINLSPIASIQVEIMRFDTQKLMNPDISGIEYQHGTLAGYEVKEYLLEKFNWTCVYQRPQCTNTKFEVEHLIPRTRGGSNRVSNLAIACEPCNKEKNDRTATEFGYPHLMDQAKRPLKDAAAVNAIRYRIGDELKALGLPVNFWSGGRTKMNRLKQNYPKDHWIDAACLGESGEKVKLNPDTKVLLVTATGRGSRQVCRVDKYGFPRTKAKSVKRIHGFQTGDIVRLTQPKGKYKGVYIGRVSVRASGTFDVSVGKQKISATWKKMKLVHRFDGYNYSLHCPPSSV